MNVSRSLRRMIKVGLGSFAAGSACIAVGLGATDRASIFATRSGNTATSVASAVFAFMALLFVFLLIRRIRFVAPSARAQRASFWLHIASDLADIELALVMSAAAFAVISVTGMVSSHAYPLLYILVAFAVTTMSRPGAIVAVGASVVLELATAVRVATVTADREAVWVAMATHLLLLGLFAGSHAVMLRGLVARYRKRRIAKLDEEISSLRESARDYRLIAAALGPSSRASRSRDEEERLLAMGGVGMIADSAHWVLTTVKQSVAAQTVALLWVDEDSQRAKLREVVSDRNDVVESSKLASTGILAAVIRDRAPLVCASTKPGQLPYYQSDEGNLALVAVPVLEGGHLRGLLCADRKQPFGDRERGLLVDAAAQLLRTVQAEQVFRAVERAKYEHERFYAAAAMLGRALTPEQVMDTTFAAAKAIVDYDVGVITLYEREHKKHRVAAARSVSEGAPLFPVEAIDGIEFKDNAGLVSMVVKNRHYLPATGELRDVTVPVFAKKVDLSAVGSALVLPLLSGDEPIGTLALFARSEKRFGKDIREMLSVIANQVATSLQNGFLYSKMETMATTDGLTGLTNHRTFQQRFADLLDRADRHGYRVAMLLCDVDHFKKVNDNYGHPVGDEVLRRVAKVLQEVPRKIDVPARYGGEEFAVLLDNVSAEQARAVAERIRIEVSKLVVETEKGPLQVTESIGVALFPDDGRDRATLIERADLALYHAKHTGRNRVVTYQDFAATRGSSGKHEIAKKAS